MGAGVSGIWSAHSYRLDWMSLDVYMGVSRCGVDKYVLIDIKLVE